VRPLARMAREDTAEAIATGIAVYTTTVSIAKLWSPAPSFGWASDLRRATLRGRQAAFKSNAPVGAPR